MLGLSLSAHNRYEYGKREPTASVLIRMADLYGVTIDYLVGRTDEKNQDGGCGLPRAQAPSQ